MDFKTILETLPTIDHFPTVAGKLGSLRVYNALAQQFNGKLDRTSAEKGLEIFAEHTADAKANPGKHPNIDLLLAVIDENKNYQLVSIFA